MLTILLRSGSMYNRRRLTFRQTGCKVMYYKDHERGLTGVDKSVREI